MVLDDDIIKSVDYSGYGVSIILGEAIEWLVKETNTAIVDKKSFLSEKAKRDTEPIVYWLVSPCHSGFDKDVNDL